MQKTTFIIISSSVIVRKGLSGIINQIEDTLIYDELENIEDLNLASSYHIPDHIIIDYKSFDEDQLKIIDNYINKYEVEVIAVSDDQDSDIFQKCRTCIELYESEENIKQKLLFCIGRNSKAASDNRKNANISEREKNVLQLVAQGFTNKEIADKLFISLHTVITHRKNITKKLGIKTVSGLTVYAILNNIIELKDIEQ